MNSVACTLTQFVTSFAIFHYANNFNVKFKFEILEIGFSFELHQTPSVQERLYENLLVNYSKYARPVKDPTAPLKLSFTFELIKIHDVVR